MVTKDSMRACECFVQYYNYCFRQYASNITVLILLFIAVVL